MISLRDKVAEKLSRLLADPPSSASSSTSSPTGLPVDPIDGNQMITLSPEEPPSTKKSSFSSYLVSFLPARRSIFDVQKPIAHDARPLPIQSHPINWKSASLASKDKQLDYQVDHGSNNDDMGVKSEENHRNGYEDFGVSTTSHCSEDFLLHLSDKSTFITSNLFAFLESSLPNIVKDCQWVLLYRAVPGNMGSHSVHFSERV